MSIPKYLAVPGFVILLYAFFSQTIANDKTENPLASIALRNDGVFVSSTNSTVTEGKMPSAHAEARVLRKAGFGSTLWVARIRKKDGVWAIARPCKTCQTLIENKGVTRVYYTIGPSEYGIWTPGNKYACHYEDKKRTLCK